MHKNSLSAELSIQKLNIKFNLAALWDTVNVILILLLHANLSRRPAAAFKTGRTKLGIGGLNENGSWMHVYGSCPIL